MNLRTLQTLTQRLAIGIASLIMSITLSSCTSAPILPATILSPSSSTLLLELTAITEMSNKLAKTEDEIRQRELGIRQGYSELIVPNLSYARLEKLDDATLLAAFDAVDSAIFYLLKPDLVVIQTNIFDELASRKLLKSFHAVKLFDNLIRLRQFEAANKIKNVYPHVSKEALPEFRTTFAYNETFPTAWILRSDARVMEQVGVQLDQQWQIVVVSHPYCSFSRKAAAEIYSDTALSAKLTGHMLWVAPQDASFSYDNFAKWNQQYPLAQHLFAHQQSVWPLAHFNQTPYFYFMKNGKVLEVVTGWPRESAKAAFIAALDRTTAK